jgi:hypothetical protein
VPFFTPVLRARRSECWAKAILLLATMNFLMAADDEPVRSLRALMAAAAIAR